MRYKRKRNNFTRKTFKLFIVFLIISVLIFILFEFKARDLIYNSVDNELEIHAMTAIDRAVADVLAKENIDYNKLILKSTDSGGGVTSLQTDTLAVNILKSHLSEKITENIKKDKSVKVSVPTGAFTGLVLLSSLGPKINIPMNLSGSVTTNIKSEFSSAGINQTLHRIYLVVYADVSLTCPIIAHETEFTTEYEIAQTVIVGNTPNTFANFSKHNN